MNYSAIIAGLAVYCLLMTVHNWLIFGETASSLRSLYDHPSVWDLYVQPLYVAVNAVAPGYIAGRMAKQHGLLHAGIVAILGAFIAPLITELYGGGSYALGVYWGITSYGILCTFSGLAGEHHAGRSRKRDHDPPGKDMQ